MLEAATPGDCSPLPEDLVSFGPVEQVVEPVFQEEIHELDLVRVARVLLAVAEVALLQDTGKCTIFGVPLNHPLCRYHSRAFRINRRLSVPEVLAETGSASSCCDIFFS